ncbi:hypothetical protein HRJ35_16245 [Shewanella oneidensis MR-1]|uniref:Lambda phage transcriptional regulator n=2 Tax=Shewanella oneidensis TaxID=70863 RepID=Q8ED29_SHEON|nr:Lambda phage transcriptional regulator [Shewanella oneidensis]AAN55955.1 Lambda phage transcriptional regulator [Shewanella oneidensis MR-1]MDX5999609.1 hypothetical protein [Shewanella oneidensis]MEE2027474.1 hypothetical protein [Shewanella oneidensis]QKG97402.1 hypothetical protein HRJ35_16245 [Shewanella oneidensis MR-1]
MRIILLFILCCCSFFLSSQELWKGAMYGDSAEKILSMYPNSVDQKMTDASDIKDLSRVISTKIELAKKPFNASFYFNNYGLKQVILHSESLFEDVEASSIEDLLTKSLVEKYGYASETADPIETSQKNKQFWAKWEKDYLIIKFLFQHEKNKMMIGYNLTADESDRLDRIAAERLLEGTSVSKEAEKL